MALSGKAAKNHQACTEPYLAPELWSLFPDRLDDEGKPEGWEVFSLETIAEHYKKSINPAKTPDAVFEHFSLPAYDKGQTPALDYGGSIKSNKTLMPSNSVLLSKLNPEIERVWMPESPLEHQQICSTEFLVFTAKNGFSRSLIYCLFSNCKFRETLQSMVTGTSKSHQRISPPALAKMDVLVGKEDIFAAFDMAISQLHNRILANRSESRTLAQTRDLLLPRLMSGEIRVREAEAIVEGVV
jgi:type I restriction enzyme S subunit